MKNTIINTARNVEKLARAICEPLAADVDGENMTAADYVTALFTSHAARKLDRMDAPAAVVAVAVAETYDAPANMDAADAVTEYARELVAARDAADAVAVEHLHRAALADMDGKTAPARRAVTLDFITDAENIMDAARAVARITAKNAVMREGTETQERIFRAARARDYDDPDLADMVQTAAAALVDCLYTDAATLDRRAAVLNAAAARLRDIPADYAAARAAVLNAARAALAADMDAAALVVDNRAALKSRAALAALMADARRAADAADAVAVFAARHAAFRAVNNYLSDARAIHTNDAPAPLSLNTDIDLAAHLTAPADDITRRAIIARRSALADALALMPPAVANTARALARGYSCRAIARRTGRDEKTIRRHRDTARAIIAAALVDMDADARRAVNVARYIDAAAMDADTAAATLAAAMDNTAARAARREREHVPAALVDAARHADTAAAMRDAARAALDLMPPAPVAVYAAIYSGMSTSDAARALNRSKGTVSEHAARIAAALVPALYAAAAVDMPAAVVVSLSALVPFLKSIDA